MKTEEKKAWIDFIYYAVPLVITIICVLMDRYDQATFVLAFALYLEYR